MYCIISLPRTASTYTWHLVNQSLKFENPSIGGESTSAFNPRYLTPEQIESKYQKIISTNPLPLIKIISNHDFSMVERIIDSKYKTIFIHPEDLRKQVLKVLVAKKTDSFVDKNRRNDVVGTLIITEDEIKERINYYNKHMSFKDKCDFSYSDRYILDTPTEFVKNLGLSYMGTKYKYTPFKHTDEEMLSDINDFNEKFQKLTKDLLWT
jgi:hypothetical protein